MNPRRLPSAARLAAALALFLGLTVSACGPTREGLSKQIIDLTARRTKIMDRLFKDWEEVANRTDWGATLENTPEILRKAAEIVEGVSLQVGRQVFDEQIRQVGRGERPLAVSKEAREFFERPDVKRRAREIVEIGLKIETLQRRLDAMG